MTIETKDILSEVPINGHLFVKVDLGQVKENLGLSRDSSLYIPQEKAFASASGLAEVVKMAKDAYGQRYKEKYGNDIDIPEIGDTVRFIPYQSSMLDKEGEYYMITDESVKSIIRKENV